MLFLKINGNAYAVFVALVMVAASSQIAKADTTKLICQMDNNPRMYEDEPTVIELNQAQGTVTVHYSATHLVNPGGITGGGDGRGGYAANTLGPVSATFSSDTISWQSVYSYATYNYSINRLTGVFTGGYVDYTCNAAQAKF